MNDRSTELAGVEVSRETLERLRDFEAFFKHWNKSINLAAPSTLGMFWDRHILDSLQLLRYRDMAEAWLDLGSGGGLPGIVVGIVALDSPLHVVLVESNRKKAAFLHACVSRYGLRAEVRAQRIESLDLSAFDIVSARALSDLTSLLQMTNSMLRPGAGRALFHKGRDYRTEVVRARVQWSFDLLEHESVVDPMSRILEISNVKRLEHS